MKASMLSVEKALSVAIKSEVVAEDVYRNLNKKVKNFVLQDKLKFLAAEEKKHQKILLGLFHRLFPEQEPSKEDKSLLPAMELSLEEEASVPDLLEMAMEAEKVSEEFYDELSQEVEDRTAKEILQYLASMEHGHYFLIKGEYDLCMRDEDYYNRDEFSVDMVHVGP
ncbi:ferritin family protein [bacterium]|nr:ferritin family protein [bacterium]